MRWLVLLVATLSVAHGYRILVVFPMPTRSHHTLGYGLVKPLLQAGHEVTYISPFYEKSTDKKLTQITVEELIGVLKGVNMVDEKTHSLGFVMTLSRNVTLGMLENPSVKQLLLHGSYDAVITEWFFNDVQAGLAAVLKCPWILLNPSRTNYYTEYLVGEPSSTAVYPLLLLNYDTPMNFWQRLTNTLATAAFMVYILCIQSPDIAVDYRDWFAPIAQARGVVLPDFSEALQNVSVLLLNHHHSMGAVPSLPLNVVELGGYHIDEDIPKLPEDIQSILDRSTEGVVYFSLGSVLQSTHFSEKTRRELLRLFGSLPYTVLWKFEEELKDVPKNVHVRPWMPQAGILAHPHTKIFITHGGLLSNLEAVKMGVPLIMIPVYGDQKMNAENAVKEGYALHVKYGDSMVEELRVALTEMVKDDRFYREAKRLSKLFKNRPVSPKNLIVHYTELAIETGGAPHLRSKALLVPWYQRMLLDQLAFVAGVGAGMVYAVKRLVRICRGGKKSIKIKKN